MKSGTMPSQDLSVYAQLLTSTSRSFLWALAFWAICNIAIAVVFLFRKKWIAFWKMTMLWNVVNVLLSLGALFFSFRSSLPNTTGLILQNFSDTRSFIAANLTMNVSYILLGIFLWKSGVVKQKPSLKSSGLAIFIQGVFLLGFDAFFFWTISSLSSQFFQQF